MEEKANPLVIVSCNGSVRKLVQSSRKCENDLANIISFKNAVIPLFQYVKKAGGNVESKLSVLKFYCFG